jgi:hypothetical protein
MIIFKDGNFAERIPDERHWNKFQKFQEDFNDIFIEFQQNILNELNQHFNNKTGFVSTDIGRQSLINISDTAKEKVKEYFSDQANETESPISLFCGMMIWYITAEDDANIGCWSYEKIQNYEGKRALKYKNKN